MKLYARIFILHLLCVAHASEVPSKEIAEPLTYVEDLRTPVQKSDGNDGQSTENPRDKRALGLLLSGLAQIFGYTVTPIQYASLANSNVTTPAAMSNSSKPVNVKQQTASSRPANTTMPRQQETIRFTGVLNLGNNSDILGHLQRYEQIFHGPRNTTTTMMMTSRPTSMPSAKISVDLTTNSPRPPLLAPFFVKIPLPIAPELLPDTTIPLEDLGLSNPTPAVSVASGSNENTETPVRKEQEMVYRSNEDTERYTVEEKDIYDEKDVRKPMNKYNHQLYVDEPSWNKQQNDRRNELQRKQKERVDELKQQEEERNRDKVVHYNEEEMNKRYRNREKEIADRNRNHASKHESANERRPAHDGEEDEDSAERYREYASQENLSNESSKQPPKKDEKEETEDYPNYDDESNKQSNAYEQPEDLDKYVEVKYNNQQLPIGDYFHDGNPEVIRNSYGEVLDNKKLEDDRISGYISMFKHPYIQRTPNMYDSERVRNPEDASREENEKETSAEDGYDEHLIRLQKLREEYALPENKYEEYDLNDESEADRNDRKSERIQNDTRRPNIERPRDKDDGRTRRPTGSNRDDVARLENAKSQEEVDFARYMPLVVPVRYIDANDKIQQATTRQLNYKEADKSMDSRFSEDNVDTTRITLEKKLTPQIGLPERPRQLHEGEHKELQVWPPPFDYAFDNTEPANTIVPPNPQNNYPQNYAPNYYQHIVKQIAAQDANDKSSEQPSGYLVVVDNPVYRYPYNIYYFSNEAVNSQGQIPHLNAEVTRPRDQVYVAQQSANQQIIQTKPNITEYNLNETTNSLRDYYQPQEVPANILDRYKYIFEERTAQSREPLNIDIISQIPNSHLKAEVTRPRNQVYVAQQSVSQQIVQTRPNITEYNLNETTNSPRDYYYQSQEVPANIYDRYRYILKERTLQAKKPYNIDVISQIPNVENWSNRIYRPQSPSNTAEQSPRPIFAQLQNIASLNQNVQNRLPERPRHSRLLTRKRKSLRPQDQRKNDEETKTPQPILKSKLFDDPQSAHDFFGFSKDDYNFGSESSDTTKVVEENGKTEESDVLVVPEPTVYHYDDESIVKHTDEPENDTEKTKVREYRNKVATLRVSERRQLKPNGPIHYVDFIRNI